MKIVFTTVLLVTVLGTSSAKEIMNEQEKQRLLKELNMYRRNLAMGRGPTLSGASDMMELTWNNLLANAAKTWSVHCSQENSKKEYRKLTNFYAVGETIFYSKTYKDAVKTWFDEYKFYDKQTNKCNKPCDNFIQVAFADTTKVGCHINKCKDKFITICQYAVGSASLMHPYNVGPACSYCPINTTCAEDLCRMLPYFNEKYPSANYRRNKSMPVESKAKTKTKAKAKAKANSAGVEQLLGLPKLCSGTGEAQAYAVMRGVED